MKDKSINEMIIDEAVNRYKNGEIKNGMDVENFLNSLLQPMMQKLLEAELDNHLDYKKYEHTTKHNNRNGHCKPKKVQTKYGVIEVSTPRDRDGNFSPMIIEKGQKKMDGFEEKCVALYAKGMSLRDIEKTLNEFYGVKINKDQIAHLISTVNESVEAWRNRPLKPIYTFTYADCLYVPIMDDLVSQKKAVYVIIGVDIDGYKEILGLWIDKSESASFWTNVFEDLKTRGVKDILYMTSDGIAGFKGSLEVAFNKTQSQRCVVHLTRNIYSLCPKKNAKDIISGFKRIYTASSKEIAELELEIFKINYEKQHASIVKKVINFMQYLEPLYELPEEIRKVIYTSNIIESVNSTLRKVTRGKGSFPSEDSVYKVLFLRINELEDTWKRPIKNWSVIQQQLIRIFGNRYTQYLSL